MRISRSRRPSLAVEPRHGWSGSTAERVEELARMIGGARATEAARAAARELLAAKRKKNKRRKRKSLSSEMKYFIETYGCQMNVHDSERMAGLLEQAGYEAAAEAIDADVVVINTCSVRERAEEKLYTRLGEIRQWAKKLGERRWWRSPAASLSRRAPRCSSARTQDDRRHRRHAEPEAAAGADRSRRCWPPARDAAASTSMCTRTCRFRLASRGGTIR